jgi:hypothetical protein
MSVKQAFQTAEASLGTLGSVGWYSRPARRRLPRRHDRRLARYSFTAHVAEVECDVETGAST